MSAIALGQGYRVSDVILKALPTLNWQALCFNRHNSFAYDPCHELYFREQTRKMMGCHVSQSLFHCTACISERRLQFCLHRPVPSACRDLGPSISSAPCIDGLWEPSRPLSTGAGARPSERRLCRRLISRRATEASQSGIRDEAFDVWIQKEGVKVSKLALASFKGRHPLGKQLL